MRIRVYMIVVEEQGAQALLGRGTFVADVSMLGRLRRPLRRLAPVPHLSTSIYIRHCATSAAPPGVTIVNTKVDAARVVGPQFAPFCPAFEIFIHFIIFHFMFAYRRPAKACLDEANRDWHCFGSCGHSAWYTRFPSSSTRSFVYFNHIYVPIYQLL